MDLEQFKKYYEDLKKTMFNSQFSNSLTSMAKSTGISFSKIEEINSLCRLVETANNRNKFNGRFMKKEIVITYEDRKLFVIFWTSFCFIFGRKPKIFYLPINFFVTSLLFWRELFTTIPVVPNDVKPPK